MAAAMSIVSPLSAEKFFFSAVIVVFLLGAWMFAGADDPQNSIFAFLMLPVAYNQLLQAGFYNFSLGAGLYLLTVGFWWRRRGDASSRTVVVTAALLLVCYFAHPMAAIIAIGSVSVLWLSSIGRHFSARHVFHLVALLPTVALLSWFFLTHHGTGPVVWAPRLLLVSYLTKSELLYTFDRRQIVFGQAFSVMMAVLLLATFAVENVARVASGARPRLRARDGFLVTVIVLVVAYFCSPADFGGGAVINQRLALFVLVSPIAWFSPRIRRMAGVPLMVTFSVIALLNAGFYLRHYRQCSRTTRDFLTVIRKASPNTVVLPLLFSRSMPGAYIGFHVHAVDYVAIERSLVDLGYYQPGTDYFPIRYNSNVRRPDILEIEGHPERIDLSVYVAADYVLTFKMPPNSAIRDQLAQGFQLEAAGHEWELYRKRSPQ